MSNPYEQLYDKSYENIVLNFWKDKNIYQKIEELSNIFTENFDNMDGPPFPNGDPHLGHMAIGGLKSTIQNHQRKMGKKVLTNLGFDCHGLPIESKICNKMNLTSNESIKQFGVNNFNQECHNFIDKVAKSWEPIYQRIGRFVDFEKTYMTKDKNFMESVWWIFKELWNKDLIYQAYKVMGYSYALETPLSNFEVSSNYKDITTNSAYVLFPLEEDKTAYFVAWTTTPWTLPSNIALCVNPKLYYIIIEDEENFKYIVEKSSLKHIKKFIIERLKKKIISKDEDKYAVIGKEYEGISYIPPYDFLELKYHKVICDEFVTECPESGTGIVHIAPAFGEIDFEVCRKYNIINNRTLNQVCPIDERGCFTEQLPSLLKGKLVFDTDSEIIINLKQRGLLLHQQQITHSYPHCERTGTKLIYRPCKSYFVAVTKIKDQVIEMNEKINWYPKNIGENRFKNWLKNAEDWCVSRNRFFGSCIPVWKTEDESEFLCIGSIDELMQYAIEGTIRPEDLHCDTIDKIILRSPTTGKLMHRTSEILDCWFESGAVPYAAYHYPFENKEFIDNKEYLSEFISEGLDQTRGWFYTLLILSTAISNKPAYKNVICTGIILDKNGIKFSKKLGNFMDTNQVIDEQTSDILRLYLLGSPLMRGEPLKYNQENIYENKAILQQFFNIINMFYWGYCEIKDKKIRYLENSENCIEIMDKWILNKIYLLRIQVIENFNNYQIEKAIYNLLDFIDIFSNYYVRMNRSRFSTDLIGLSVLYTVIMDYINLISPITPFMSEYIYLNMKIFDLDKFKQESIHMLKYPDSNFDGQNIDIFEVLFRIIRKVRQWRSKSNTHVSLKLPFNKCIIYHCSQELLDNINKHIKTIGDEINSLSYETRLLTQNFTYQLIPNHKEIGIFYKGKGNLIKKYLMELTQEELKSGGKFIFNNEIIEEKFFEIIKKPIEKENFITDEDISIELDISINQEVDDLYLEKCFSSFVNKCRKELGLKPNNKLIILYDQPNDFEFFIQKNKEKYNFMKYLENNSMKYIENNDQQLINKIFEFKNKSIKLYLLV